MPITAKSIIRRSVETLQDTTSIRWPVAELVRYLNDGQREIAAHRPDSMVTNATVTCAAGTKQTLPANGAKLIDVVRNAAATSNKSAIRQTSRDVLDASVGNWHSITPSVNIMHYVFDARDPRTFYTYPPATTSAQLDIVYSAYPTDVTEPADGSTWDAVTGNISVQDIHANALQDYILARCYTKDSEFAGNAARAQAHYTLFASALGIELKGTIDMAPSAKVARGQ